MRDVVKQCTDHFSNLARNPSDTLLDRKIKMMFPQSSDYTVTPPRPKEMQAQARLQLGNSFSETEIQKAVSKRDNQLRYHRAALKATMYVRANRGQPQLPEDQDKEQLKEYVQTSLKSTLNDFEKVFSIYTVYTIRFIYTRVMIFGHQF